jgi:hypothetical protein
MPRFTLTGKLLHQTMTPTNIQQLEEALQYLLGCEAPNLNKIHIANSELVSQKSTFGHKAKYPALLRQQCCGNLSPSCPKKPSGDGLPTNQKRGWKKNPLMGV